MKLKTLFYSAGIVLVIIIQTTLADYLAIHNVKPNLMIVFIVSIALLKGNVQGSVVGLILGLVQDMLTGKVLGFYALLGLYLGVAVGSLNKRLYRENLAIAVFFTFTSTMVYEFAVYFLNTFTQSGRVLVDTLKEVILPEAVYNSVISILIYTIVLKVHKKIEAINKTSRKY